MGRTIAGKFMLGISLIVATVLLVTLIWEFNYQSQTVDRELRLRADLLARTVQATRSFVSRSQDSVHGVPQKLGPAEFQEGVKGAVEDISGSKVKQTRLVVREGKNEPDEFERAALIRFANDPDLKEVFGQEVDAVGDQVYRYLIPLRAEKSCLTCHGEPAGTLDKTGHVREGMKEGDLAGAISLTLPMAELLRQSQVESIRLAAGIVVLAIMSLGLFWFILWRQVTVPLEELVGVAESIGGGRVQVPPEALEPLQANHETAAVGNAFLEMSARLQESYADLEKKVQERTAQLQSANLDLERASRLKSQFLAMVSHEFRTPMTSIITFTELLLDQKEKLSPEQEESLTDILESSQRLLKLINDLLDLTRVEAGRLALFSEYVALKEMVRDAERIVRPLADKEGVTLSVIVPDDLPLIHADPLRITQVLVNLLDNGVKFTPPGGAVLVYARVADGGLEVSVSDTGVGIPSEDMDRLFKLFQQGSGTRAHGSGLGLALCKSLVEMHCGRIWVESEVGRGSTVRFTLPLRCDKEGCQQ